jgi:LacI family transcriptional regulator
MSTAADSSDFTGGRATIQDVARHAGVSIATVSRVVNGHPDVSPATRAEVMKFVHELGYVSNRVSEPRAGRQTRLIGLAVPTLRGDYISEIVTGAVDGLRENGARLVICPANGMAEHDTTLRERLMQNVTDGALIVLPSEEEIEELRGLLRTGYPFVVIEPTMTIQDGIPAVAATNWAGARTATDYLIGLGHTHIGVISGPSHGSVSADRLSGYHAALLASGLPLTPQPVQEADWTIEGGHEAAKQLLGLRHVPTAIFALNDAMAVGALRALAEEGLNVPQDISVMGYDDIELASVTAPALTTIQQPLQGLGRVGANVLYRLLEGQELDANRIELSTRLVVRQSTARPRGTSFLTV